MDDKQRRALIDRIVEEVLYRIKERQPSCESLRGTVALVTSYVPSLKNALETVKGRYGKDVTYINFGTGFAPVTEEAMDAGQAGEQAVLAKVAGAANILLLTPKIGLLEDIAAGRDEGFVQHLMIRGLLWRRDVGILLDFDPPRFKRNTFYEKIATAVAALEDMGVRLMTYECASYTDARGLALVTENDVMEAQKNNQAEILCAANAIVTPAARDKANELGVKIN